MLGASSYTTRSALLREKHAGETPEVDAATQMRFDNGHRSEALARPLAEQIIGEELYPVTAQVDVPGIGRPLLASLDGLTMDGTVGFEHKTLGQELRQAFKDGAADDANLLPLHYRAQMAQQCLVAGCERVLFMASSWDAEGDLLEEHHCWYLPDAALNAQLVMAWSQFERDLSDYQPAPAAEVVTAEPQEHLPAVSVQVTGELTVASNLAAFGVALRAFVERIPKKPSTDTEFATAEAACKRLKEAEERLQAAEDAALGSMADVNTMCQTVATLRDLARTTRLASEKLVKQRKEQIRSEEVQRGQRVYVEHIAALNERLGGSLLPSLQTAFGDSIKGLKTLESVRNAIDTELARAKIAANEIADRIQVNLNTLRELAANHTFLFSDTATIVLKAHDDFTALVKLRIAEHDRKETERLERERERIRQEEAAKLAAAQRQEEERKAREETQRAPAPPLPATRAPWPFPSGAAPAVTADQARKVTTGESPVADAPRAIVMGRITFIEGDGEEATEPFGLLIRFADPEQLRAALKAQRVEFKIL